MKNLKKYVATSLLLAVIVAVGIGHTPNAEAYQGNSSWGQSQNVSRLQIRTQDMTHQQLQQMVQLLTQLQTRLRQLLQLRDQRFVADGDVVVVTRYATDIEEDEALLQGRIALFGGSDYADVWFEYDDDRSDLDQKTSTQRIDEDEDRYFDQWITGLEEDETYYFRAVAEDDNGDIDYGSVEQFTTDDSGSSSNDDEPEVVTRSAVDVRDDQADLRGTVDMNDFNNGRVFFVYGEDEDQVEDVEDDYDTYAAVEENGDDLQKVRVDTDLDGQASYVKEVDGLDSDTGHYFTLCVEYQDEDGDETLECGAVREFTTDN